MTKKKRIIFIIGGTAAIIFLSCILYIRSNFLHSDELNLIEMDESVKKESLLRIKNLSEIKLPFTIENVTSTLDLKDFYVHEYVLALSYYIYPQNVIDPTSTVMIKEDSLIFIFIHV